MAIVPVDNFNLDDLCRQHLHGFRSALKQQDLSGARKKLANATSVWQQLRQSLRQGERQRGLKSFRYRAVVGLANQLCEARAAETRVQDQRGVMEVKVQRVLQRQFDISCRTYQKVLENAQQGLILAGSPERALATTTRALEETIQCAKSWEKEVVGLDAQDVAEAEELLAKCQVLVPMYEVFLQLQAFFCMGSQEMIQQLSKAKEAGHVEFLWDLIQRGEVLFSSDQSSLIPSHFLTTYKNILCEAKVVAINLDAGIQPPAQETIAAPSTAAAEGPGPGQLLQAMQNISSYFGMQSPASDDCAQVPETMQSPSAVEEVHVAVPGVVEAGKEAVETEGSRAHKARLIAMKATQDREAAEMGKLELQQRREKRRKKQQLLAERRDQENKQHQHHLKVQRQRLWKQQEDEQIFKESERQRLLEEARLQKEEEEKKKQKTTNVLGLFGTNQKTEPQVGDYPSDGSLQDQEGGQRQELDSSPRVRSKSQDRSPSNESGQVAK